ncbi:MAG: hypothetical protein GYA48_08360 [Chloroflexi bacterium]|nr:hypothetical protein [Chloroflexota bacterium]
MILLNFSHPISAEQICQLEALSGQPLERVFDLPTQFDNNQPFQPQLDALLASIPLDAQAWQTAPILVNLPSLNFIAGLLLASLHGRMGYFPPILRTRPVPESLPPRFEIAEILNLQKVRERARETRYE